MFSRVASALFPALLPVLLALPACATEGAAADGGPATAANEATGETAADLKGGPLFDDTQFPMKAADFQKKLDERRAKMESFGKKRHHDGPPPGGNATEDAERKAKHEAKRAEFKAKIDAKVAEITADGTVTLDEAKELRTTFFAGRGGPGHHGPGGNGPGGRGPGGPGGPGGHELEGLQFPVPAADFRQKVDARRQQMKARFEEHAKDMPADKVAEIRAHIAKTEATFDAKLTEITADGTVTKEEAEALKSVVMQNFKRP